MSSLKEGVLPILADVLGWGTDGSYYIPFDSLWFKIKSHCD